MNAKNFVVLRSIIAMIMLFMGMNLNPFSVAAIQEQEPAKSVEDIFKERMQIYDEVSATSGIPWYYLAAIDQYERTLNRANPKTRPAKKDGVIGIYYSARDWAGLVNPDPDDTHPISITYFNGMGKDGSGDGLADRHDDLDAIYTMVSHILKHGTSPDDFRIGLWEYYQNTRSVLRIEQFAKLYAQFNQLDLFEHAFPVPLRSTYSYRSTWGAARSFGGYRIHEGTDIFAGYGTPVRSTSYGIVEVKGWNRYGGWRIGIRDLNNVYHYYAHMSGFSKEFEEGGIVQPGDVVGWVGSSGYGKPGTQGKFAPHLHYGTYRDSGINEWSFDPYPLLSKWEREERRRK